MLDFDERPDLGRENGVWDLGSAEAAELAIEELQMMAVDFQAEARE